MFEGCLCVQFGFPNQMFYVSVSDSSFLLCLFLKSCFTCLFAQIVEWNLLGVIGCWEIYESLEAQLAMTYLEIRECTDYPTLFLWLIGVDVCYCLVIIKSQFSLL